MAHEVKVMGKRGMLMVDGGRVIKHEGMVTRRNGGWKQGNGA